MLAIPSIATSNPNLPADLTKRMIKNDFTWAATNRDRIIAEWTKRYDGKSGAEEEVSRQAAGQRREGAARFIPVHLSVSPSVLRRVETLPAEAGRGRTEPALPVRHGAPLREARQRFGGGFSTHEEF